MSFQAILKDIVGIPGYLFHFFTSPKAEAALKQAATLAIDAAPYVAEVNLMVAPLLGPAGELTAAAVNAAYAKYAIPLATEIVNATPMQLGNYLLNLVTTLLQKNHAPTASITVLNTAVQLAKLTVGNATSIPATA